MSRDYFGHENIESLRVLPLDTQPLRHLDAVMRAARRDERARLWRDIRETALALGAFIVLGALAYWVGQ